MLLIAKYDCYVSGEKTDSVDYQVKHYDVNISEDMNLEAMLQTEEREKYLNEEKEEVEWIFDEILAIDWEPKFEHGNEVIGFITGQPSPLKDD